MTSTSEFVAPRSCLFRVVVPLGGDDEQATTQSTEWFDQPEEGALVHVEWGEEVAVLTYMLTRYPALVNGLGRARESTHYYGDTCLGGHGELADIERGEAAHNEQPSEAQESTQSDGQDGADPQTGAST